MSTEAKARGRRDSNHCSLQPNLGRLKTNLRKPVLEEKKKTYVALLKSRNLGVTKFGFGSCLHASFVTSDDSFNISDPSVSHL